MCKNQENIWVCEYCEHKDHAPQDCKICDCYNCEARHDDGGTGYCCHCAEMEAKYGCDEPCEEESGCDDE